MSKVEASYVILGGSSDVGKVLAEKLLSDGSNIVMTGRDSGRASELAAAFQCETAVATAGNAGSIEAAVQLAVSRFGKVDGVVNCIGSVLLKPAHLTSDDEWAETITTNLTSSFYLVRAAAKAMRQNGGSIVLVSSAAAKAGLANHEAIAAAKAGIIGLTLSAAATYAARRIRVNAIAPGLVKSEMTRKLWDSDAAAAASLQMHALGRLGEPKDVARSIAWLLDPENDWITGQSVAVDGGLSSIVPRLRS